MNTNDYGQKINITKLSLIHISSESKENRSATATHLSVKLDEKLTFKFHVNNLYRRLQREVFRLMKKNQKYFGSYDLTHFDTFTR